MHRAWSLEKGWPQTRVATAAALSVEQRPLQEPAAPTVSTGHDLAAVKEAIVAEFPSVFQDAPFSPMAGPPMHINLRSDAGPCQHYRTRIVPFQWRDVVEAQLSSMMSIGVIEKVPLGESLTLCHPMVVVPKKLSAMPRITVDLTKRNKYVSRLVYPLRVPSKIVVIVLPPPPPPPPDMKYSPRWSCVTGTGRFPLMKPVLSLRLSSTPGAPIVYDAMLWVLCWPAMSTTAEATRRWRGWKTSKR